MPNEANGYAGAGSGISGDACCRLRQQRNQPHPYAIADACSNSVANSNPFTDTCTYTYSNPNPICDSYSENYSHPDSHPCDSGVVGPI